VNKYILTLAGGVAALALLAGGAAAQHSGGGSHEASAPSSDSTSHTEDHTDHEGGASGAKGAGGKGKAGGGASQGGRKSMEDILRDVGAAAGEEEDSDRPDWAGEKGGKAGTGGGKPPTAGSARGDTYGDLWVILRDDQGVPILSDAGFVQPLDAQGNLIPLDSEGAPLDPTLVVEVELGRTNVGRSPTRVLDTRASEVVTMLNDADAVSLDAAGRLVVTTDGVAKTIDSPLENLAIYVALLTQGTIPGVTDLPGEEFDTLVDGKFTAADLTSAASFLAASTDKSSPLSVDEIAYLDRILDINIATVGDVTYSDVEYEGFSYDRSDAYGDVTVTVLVQQPDGSFVPKTVNVYESVFASTDYTASGTISAFTQAAEDARLVVDFLHEGEVPTTTASSPTSRGETPSISTSSDSRGRGE